jgi:hypothetical protein
LAEAALGVQAEVEEEDGGLDEPDAEGEDVFCSEVVLFLLVDKAIGHGVYGTGEVLV